MKKLFLLLASYTITFADICSLDFVKQELDANNNLEQFSTAEVKDLGVKCEGNILTYDYMYNEPYSSQISQGTRQQRDATEKFMQNLVMASYCNMPEFEPYRQNNVELIYNYLSTSKELLFKVSVKNSDCKK